jgi:hypothetical protein
MPQRWQLRSSRPETWRSGSAWTQPALLELMAQLSVVVDLVLHHLNHWKGGSPSIDSA